MAGKKMAAAYAAHFSRALHAAAAAAAGENQLRKAAYAHFADVGLKPGAGLDDRHRDAAGILRNTASARASKGSKKAG